MFILVEGHIRYLAFKATANSKGECELRSLSRAHDGYDYLDRQAREWRRHDGPACIGNVKDWIVDFLGVDKDSMTTIPGEDTDSLREHINQELKGATS